MQSKIMTAGECARRIVRAIEKRQRLAVLSTRGKWGRWLKLLAPSLIDRIAARAIRQRH
jgi:short-subunit dehydrogenase